MYGIILALHHDARFVQRAGSAERAQVSFERLLQSYVNPMLSSSKTAASQNLNPL